MGRKNTIESVLERVLQDVGGGCWLWQGYTNDDGYGVVGFEGRNHRTHKLIYQTLRDVVPNGYDLHHKCLNKHCCNPDHLEQLPKAEHSKLSPGVKIITARKKSATHCPNGHAWTPSNTGKGARGSRRCRACHVIEVTRARQRRKDKERIAQWSHV